MSRSTKSKSKADDTANGEKIKPAPAATETHEKVKTVRVNPLVSFSNRMAILNEAALNER